MVFQFGENITEEKIGIERLIKYLTNDWYMIVTVAAVMITTTVKIIIRINILGSMSDMLEVLMQSGDIRKCHWFGNLIILVSLREISLINNWMGAKRIKNRASEGGSNGWD